MVDGKRVAVVVPAHNKKQLIGTTLAGIPEFVDHVIVVDDSSTDDTASIATALGSDRIELVQRNENGGVGAAIVDEKNNVTEGAIGQPTINGRDSYSTPEYTPTISSNPSIATAIVLRYRITGPAISYPNVCSICSLESSTLIGKQTMIAFIGFCVSAQTDQFSNLT